MLKTKQMFIVIVCLLVIFQVSMTVTSWRNPRKMPTNPQSLSRCPESPNCVSSVDDDRQHRVEPLSFTGDADAAFARVREVVERMPRTKIVTSSDEYLHATFTTMIMRYTDDVEFLLDRPSNTIAVRSASRIGNSDLGTNRRRVEQIRKEFNASQ